jgi:putative heme iron utilization protein
MQNVKPPPGFTAREARLLLREARSATLSSLLEGGSPHGSLVNIATDRRGRPLLLLSRLAWHTRNLEADGRASLLVVGKGTFSDPLEGPRVTVMGRMSRVDEVEARDRYLAAHPKASFYAGFKDFGWWRMEIEQAHAVAGFGRIETFAGDDVVLSEEAVAGFGEREAAALAHMNQDHLDAIALYATRLLGEPPGEWRIAACDPDGADLTDGARGTRLAFDAPVRDGEELKATLVELARRARAREAPGAGAG